MSCVDTVTVFHEKLLNRVLIIYFILHVLYFLIFIKEEWKESLCATYVKHYYDPSFLTAAYKVLYSRAILTHKIYPLVVAWLQPFPRCPFVNSIHWSPGNCFQAFSVSFCKHKCCMILMKALEHNLERVSRISVRCKLLPYKISCKYSF